MQLCNSFKVHLSASAGRFSGEGDLTTGNLAVSTDVDGVQHFASELEHYRAIFAFPEEVALRLARTEVELFLRVSSTNYLRYVASESLHHSVPSYTPPTRSVTCLATTGNVTGALSCPLLTIEPPSGIAGAGPLSSQESASIEPQLSNDSIECKILL